MVKVFFASCHARWIPAAKSEMITLNDAESRRIDQNGHTLVGRLAGALAS